MNPIKNKTSNLAISQIILNFLNIINLGHVPSLSLVFFSQILKKNREISGNQYNNNNNNNLYYITFIISLSQYHNYPTIG